LQNSRRQSRTAQRITFIGLGALLLIALAVSLSAALTPRFPGDLPLTRWIQAWATPWLDTAIQGVNSLSDVPVAVGGAVVMAAGLALVRRWQEGAAFLGVLLLEGLLQVIKLLVDRPRPSEDLVRVLVESGNTDGFPSGHMYHAVVFWGLLLVLVVVRIQPLWLRRGITLLLLVFILLSGVSRVYVGAHWPSDVLGSVVLGIPSVALLFYLCQRLKRVGDEPKNLSGT